MFASLDRSSGKAVALAIGTWLVASGASFALGPYSTVRERGGDLLEEHPRDPAEALSWLNALGPDARDAYSAFQWVDLGVALLTAVAVFVALAFALPVIVFAAEIIENLVLGTALARYPDSESLLSVAETVTTVKLPLAFAALGATAGGLLAVAVRSLWQRIQARQPPSSPA